jgi:hypothetical protein
VRAAPRNSANICGFNLGNLLRTVASIVIATKIAINPSVAVRMPAARLDTMEKPP